MILICKIQTKCPSVQSSLTEKPSLPAAQYPRVWSFSPSHWPTVPVHWFSPVPVPIHICPHCCDAKQTVFSLLVINPTEGSFFVIKDLDPLRVCMLRLTPSVLVLQQSFAQARKAPQVLYCKHNCKRLQFNSAERIWKNISPN